MTGEKRLALELLILAALAARCVLAAQYPVLRLEWEARCAVEEEHPGRAERVWRGRVSGSGAGDQAVMVRSGAAAGLSVLTWYEGSPSFFIWRGPIPEGLTVTAVPGGSGPPLEYMALELPEGAVSGRLTAELLGGGCENSGQRPGGGSHGVPLPGGGAELAAGAGLPAGRDLLEGGPGECALYADSLGPERGPDF